VCVCVGGGGRLFIVSDCFVLDFTWNYKKFLPSCCHQETLLFIWSYYEKALSYKTTWLKSM